MNVDGQHFIRSLNTREQRLLGDQPERVAPWSHGQSRHRPGVWLLRAALTDPGQAPARTLAAVGVHRPLKIADVGAHGDA
jgi:hypothetical protein